MPDTPFGSIEGSYRYIAMLAEAIEEAQSDIDVEISLAIAEQASRRKEALQLVAFNLNKLNAHITASSRILNDLRTLQRLLLEEPEAQVRSAAE